MIGTENHRNQSWWGECKEFINYLGADPDNFDPHSKETFIEQAQDENKIRRAQTIKVYANEVVSFYETLGKPLVRVREAEAKTCLKKCEERIFVDKGGPGKSFRSGVRALFTWAVGKKQNDLAPGFVDALKGVYLPQNQLESHDDFESQEKPSKSKKKEILESNREKWNGHPDIEKLKGVLPDDNKKQTKIDRAMEFYEDIFNARNFEGNAERSDLLLPEITGEELEKGVNKRELLLANSSDRYPDLDLRHALRELYRSYNQDGTIFSYDVISTYSERVNGKGENTPEKIFSNSIEENPQQIVGPVLNEERVKEVASVYGGSERSGSMEKMEGGKIKQNLGGGTSYTFSLEELPASVEGRLAEKQPITLGLFLGTRLLDITGPISHEQMERLSELDVEDRRGRIAPNFDGKSVVSVLYQDARKGTCREVVKDGKLYVEHTIPLQASQENADATRATLFPIDSIPSSVMRKMRANAPKPALGVSLQLKEGGLVDPVSPLSRLEHRMAATNQREDCRSM